MRFVLSLNVHCNSRRHTCLRLFAILATDPAEIPQFPLLGPAAAGQHDFFPVLTPRLLVFLAVRLGHDAQLGQEPPA